MFVIGLEFNLPKLMGMRKLVFGFGMAQVMVTLLGAVAGHALLWWLLQYMGLPWDLSWQGALALGAAFAMSSTAIVVKMMADRAELETPHGQRVMGALLFQDLDHSDMFVSAQLMWFENATGSITIASAGHCPALIVDRNGRQLVEARGEGPPLGIDVNATFAEVTLDERQACHILMLTDGVTDARNPRGEMLGKDAIVSCLMQFTTTGGDAAQLQASVLAVIEQHVQNAPTADDITLVVLSRDPQAKPLNLNPHTP
jgi:serine phosphatase RsbU (regulator of sigma subunit)